MSASFLWRASIEGGFAKIWFNIFSIKLEAAQ